MENIELKSLEETAVEVLKQEKTQLTYLELFNKVAELKGFNDEEKAREIARFYTDITSSGNFVYCGDDKWGLKEDLPLDALDSEFYSEHNEIELEDEDLIKPKKKAKKSKKITHTEDGQAFVDLTYNDLAQESDKDDDYLSEDESYENLDGSDDYEDYVDDDDDSQYDDEYEREEDYDDYDEDDDDDDDFDEDRYNDIMDDYEDRYDK